MITYNRQVGRWQRVTLPEEHLVYTGKTYKVEFCVRTDASLPAHESYEEELSEDDKRRFFVIIGHFADSPVGTIFPKSIYNIEDKKNAIYAFKPYQHRFFCFTTSDRRVILTNAYKKGAQKLTKKAKQALKTAIEMKKDYENRVKKGTYYEKS